MWDICHFISHLSYFRIIDHAGTGIQNILAMCDLIAKNDIYLSRLWTKKVYKKLQILP